MSFPFDPGYGMIIVTVELLGPTGGTLLRMALDTVATTSRINATPRVWVGYDPALSPDRVQVTTGSGVEYAPLVTVQ
jgi:hypothetical protein